MAQRCGLFASFCVMPPLISAHYKAALRGGLFFAALSDFFDSRLTETLSKGGDL
jgi:hypothetical protein